MAAIALQNAEVMPARVQRVMGHLECFSARSSASLTRACDTLSYGA
jgi:hypothetical protein